MIYKKLAYPQKLGYKIFKKLQGYQLIPPTVPWLNQTLMYPLTFFTLPFLKYKTVEKYSIEYFSHKVSLLPYYDFKALSRIRAGIHLKESRFCKPRFLKYS